MREHLKTLPLEDMEKVKESILTLLSDPERVDEAQGLMANLEEQLSKHSDEHAEVEPEEPEVELDPKYKTLLEEWREAGFRVDILEKVIQTKDLDRIEKNFTVFNKRAVNLKRMGAMLEKIKIPELQDEISELLPMLNDVTKYKEAKEIFQGIVEKAKKS